MQWFALPKRYVIGRITWLLPYKVGTRLTDASVGSIFLNSEERNWNVIRQKMKWVLELAMKVLAKCETRRVSCEEFQRAVAECPCVAGARSCAPMIISPNLAY